MSERVPIDVVGSGGRGDVAVRATDLGVIYRGAGDAALRGVSLSIGRGELVLVMGATGSGKSTLIKSLARIVPCFQPATVTGAIEILGEPTVRRNVRDLAGTVGVIFQDFEAQLFSTNVRCEVAFAMEQLGVAPAHMPGRGSDALAAVGLAGFAERDPATLSGGEKQRLAIAGLLAVAPAVLLLDEPTTDLDPIGKLEVLRLLGLLRQRGCAVLVAEHEIAAAAVADRIVLLRHGEILATGAPHELLPHVALFEECGVRPHDLAIAFRDLGVGVDGAWLGGFGGDPPASAFERAREALVAAGFPAAVTVAPPSATPEGPRSWPPEDDGRAGAGETRLVVEHVSFEYRPGARALDDVSLGIDGGEFVAVIGQNGSGKTTLAKLLSGLLSPGEGRVSLDGRDVRTLGVSALAARVGFVFQDPDHQLFAATAAEEVGFGPRNLGLAPEVVRERTAAALAAVGLEARADVDPFLLDKGARQRLAVAAVLSMHPSVLILDEPTTGLDHTEQRTMVDLLRRLNAGGTTIIIITHSPWVVAECVSRVVLMAGGTILWDGALRGLFTRPDLLERAAFRTPDITALAARFGITALTVAEFTAALGEARC